MTTRRRFLASTLCAPVLLAACNDDTTPTATRYATAMKRVVDLYGLPGAIASVRVPGDVTEILLEVPGPPQHDDATAAQVRALVTKGALFIDRERSPTAIAQPRS